MQNRGDVNMVIGRCIFGWVDGSVQVEGGLNQVNATSLREIQDGD